jgi:transcriptional regulator with XRE-family HTH domain
MDSEDEIRARISARLAELSLDVKPASVKAGLGETTLRNYLKGMTNSLTFKTVEKLAGALDVTPRWILFGEDSPEIVDIMDRIPGDRRDHALNVLRTFVA